MRKYANVQENVLSEVTCNKCGKSLKVENGFIKEGSFHVEHSFGYFSTKDGMRHVWDLCEACYDKLIQEFVIPVEETEESEFL